MPADVGFPCAMVMAIVLLEPHFINFHEPFVLLIVWGYKPLSEDESHGIDFTNIEITFIPR